MDRTRPVGLETGSYRSILRTGPEVTNSGIKGLESQLFTLAGITSSLTIHST